MNVLTIFTGGTVGSVYKDGKISLDQNRYKLIEKSRDKFDLSNITFHNIEPFFVLSENMTVDYWNQLIEVLAQVDYKKYDGIVITHGTDTLAYTANLLAMLLGNIGIPVVLVSSGSDLDDETENGTYNLRSALALIQEELPGVFVPYRQEGKDVIHLGSRITQSRHFFDDFLSILDIPYAERNEEKINYNIHPYNIEETDLKAGQSLLLQYPLFQIQKRIMMISPYVGFSYDDVLLNNVAAVLQGTYHSGTFCLEEESFRRFYKKCVEKEIPMFLAPIEEAFSKKPYESTHKAKAAGMIPIVDVTLEAAYTKLLLLSQIYQGDALKEHINDNLFYEKISKKRT